MDLPEPSVVEEVFSALKPEGAAKFGKEIAVAVARSRELGDFRGVQEVVMAWYTSLLIRRAPGFHEAFEWAQSVEVGPDTGMTFEEFRAEFQLPEPTPREL